MTHSVDYGNGSEVTRFRYEYGDLGYPNEIIVGSGSTSMFRKMISY